MLSKLKRVLLATASAIAAFGGTAAHAAGNWQTWDQQGWYEIVRSPADGTCIANSNFRNNVDLSFVSTADGTATFMMTSTNPAWVAMSRSRSGETFTGAVAFNHGEFVSVRMAITRYTDDDNRGGVMFRPTAEFIETFAKANTMQVRTNNGSYVSYDLTYSMAALTSLVACHQSSPDQRQPAPQRQQPQYNM
jgi:hypothetical protein